MRVKRIYLRFLSLSYATGFILHVMDLFGQRLHFSEMDALWKAWIIYLAIFDGIAAVGLWSGKAWGTALFVMIAVSQLIAYLGFKDIFDDQSFLIYFHITTLAGWALISAWDWRKRIALQASSASMKF